ncbi:MAG TPA: hypothetical protein PLL69_11575 [Gemmatimonadales bacterium]|nr:hypothetical protein [Gemmatimonadales bacterium]
MRLQYSLLLLALAGCSSGDTAAPDDTASWRQPGDVIDSILPMAEHERRFREGVPEAAVLQGGESSREKLAARFLEAVASSDTASLRSMLISRSEFAWLVFPSHVYREPPYELDPAIFWMQIGTESSKGMGRVMERHGGRPIAFKGLDCQRDTLQLTDLGMEMWGPCQVRYTIGDSTLTRRLFGSMLEKDGRVKFLSYANDF